GMLTYRTHTQLTKAFGRAIKQEGKLLGDYYTKEYRTFLNELLKIKPTFGMQIKIVGFCFYITVLFLIV
ncbi:hypothetical protein QV06_00405, partial [Gallibacterium genomosp. 3]